MVVAVVAEATEAGVVTVVVEAVAASLLPTLLLLVAADGRGMPTRQGRGIVSFTRLDTT